MKYTEFIEYTNDMNNVLMSKALCIAILLKHCYLVSKLQITIHQQSSFVEIYARIVDIDKWLSSIFLVLTTETLGYFLVVAG